MPAVQGEVRFVTNGQGSVPYVLIKADKDEIKAVRVEPAASTASQH